MRILPCYHIISTKQYHDFIAYCHHVFPFLVYATHKIRTIPLSYNTFPINSINKATMPDVHVALCVYCGKLETEITTKALIRYMALCRNNRYHRTLPTWKTLCSYVVMRLCALILLK